MSDTTTTDSVEYTLSDMVGLVASRGPITYDGEIVKDRDGVVIPGIQVDLDLIYNSGAMLGFITVVNHYPDEIADFPFLNTLTVSELGATYLQSTTEVREQIVTILHTRDGQLAAAYARYTEDPQVEAARKAWTDAKDAAWQQYLIEHRGIYNQIAKEIKTVLGG